LGLYDINFNVQDIEKQKIIIIGGGPAGYKTAIELKKLCDVLDITLIEKHKLGGTCLHAGCIPSKQLHTIESLEQFPSLLQKNQLLLEKGIQSEFKKLDIKLITGTACINTEDQTVIIDNQERLTYSQLIIATGSKPRRLSQFPQALTSDELFNIENLKQGLGDNFIIIGGGYIGVELASMLAKHNKKVQLFEQQKKILGFLDDDIQIKIHQELIRQGILIHTGIQDLSSIPIEKNDTVIVAVGRENHYPQGFDPNQKANNIHIIGDLSNEFSLAHYAYMQARQLAYKIMGKDFSFRKDLVPLVIFAHPELASIGLTEKSAVEIHGSENVSTQLINWASNAKARIMGADRGLTKIVYLKSTGKILGAHLIGKSSSDLISIMIPVLQQNLRIEDMKTWIFPHPTLGELFAI
jgi:dihydrolipoamide dehydrogenase